MRTSRTQLPMAVLALAGLVGNAGHTIGQEKEQKTDKPQAEQKAQSDERAVKSAEESEKKGSKQSLEVYKLKKINSSTALNLLRSNNVGLVSHTAAYRALPSAQAQVSQTGQTGQANRVHVASDDESNRLFLRGPEEEVKKVLELIKYVDQDQPKERLETKEVTFLPIDSKRVESLNSIAQQLGLNCQVMNVGENSFVLLKHAKEADADQQQREHLMLVIDNLSSGSDSDEESGAKDAEQNKDAAENSNEQPDEGEDREES